MYHGNPQMNRLVIQKPVRKRALGTHHIRVLLRRHALLVFLGWRRAIDFILQIPVWRTLAVRGWAVLVWLWYYGWASLLLLGELAAAEFLGEALASA